MAELTQLAIIVCTRERPEMLALALESIAAKTPPEVEILVVDSASTSWRTRQVALAAGMRYVRSDVKGLSIARNLGLRSTDRDLVLYTDDDCKATDGWTERLIGHFDDASLGAVTGRMLDHTLVDADVVYSRRQVFTSVIDGLDSGHGAVMAFRRQLLLDLGGFDEVLGAGRMLAGADDLDMFCRVLDAKLRVVHDAQSIVHHVNTRVGDDYTALLRGYGLGLGALSNKWVRRRFGTGVAMIAILLKRAVSRAIRAAWHRNPVRARDEMAAIGGILRGFVVASRFPLAGQVFGDLTPPAPLVLTPEHFGDGGER